MDKHNFEFTAIDKNYLSHIQWPENHPCAGQNIELRDYQVETINKFIENPQCIQEIATGAGKTIITAALCQLVEPYGRTITIVPNKSLVTQTEEDFVACNLDTGVYYGDRKDIGRMLKVFYESFANKKKRPAMILKTSGASFSILDKEEIIRKIKDIKKNFPSNLFLLSDNSIYLVQTVN